MKKLVLLLLALCIPAAAVAGEFYIGTITSSDSSTSKNQSTTSTSFPMVASQRIAFICDAAVYYNWGVSSTSVVASSTGIAVPANTLQDTSSGVKLIYLNIISQSGAANCKVFNVGSW